MIRESIRILTTLYWMNISSIVYLSLLFLEKNKERFLQESLFSYLIIKIINY